MQDILINLEKSIVRNDMQSVKEIVQSLAKSGAINDGAVVNAFIDCARRALDQALLGFIEGGLRVDAANGVGTQALDVARDESTIQILTMHGADIEAIDDRTGRNFLQKSIHLAIDFNSGMDLKHAIALLRSGAKGDASHPVQGPAIVKLCTLKSHHDLVLECVKEMIARGASLDDKDPTGQSAWGLLCAKCAVDAPSPSRHTRNDLIDFLVDTGRSFDIDSGQRYVVFFGLCMEDRGRDISSLHAVQPLPQHQLDSLLTESVKQERIQACLALLELGAKVPHERHLEHRSDRVKHLMHSLVAKNEAKEAMKQLNLGSPSAHPTSPCTH